MRKKKTRSNAGEELIRRVGELNKPCSFPECKLSPLPLSVPTRCPAHLEDFEKWVRAVEAEKDWVIQTLAREQYVVMCEEFAPVSGFLYHKAAGEPPPGRHAMLDPVLTFMALAAASGVIGNLGYDLLKGIILRLVGRREEKRFEQKISFEVYEESRSTVHTVAASTLADTARNVQREIEVKYRLLVETRRARRQ
jgi:hypothetical protein